MHEPKSKTIGGPRFVKPVKVQGKGSTLVVTIPKEVAERLGVQDDDMLWVYEDRRMRQIIYRQPR